MCKATSYWMILRNGCWGLQVIFKNFSGFFWPAQILHICNRNTQVRVFCSPEFAMLNPPHFTNLWWTPNFKAKITIMYRISPKIILRQGNIVSCTNHVIKRDKYDALHHPLYYNVWWNTFWRLHELRFPPLAFKRVFQIWNWH